MTSTFKLTKAEFVKIFKKPSIFIMAVLLVVTIFASLSMFNPSYRVDNSIIYEGAETSQEYYNSFQSDTSVNSKLTFDNSFALTDTMINYYESVNNNTALLSDYYYVIVSTMEKMSQHTQEELRDECRLDLIGYLNSFYEAYRTLDSLGDFETIITPTITSIDYTNYYDSRNYYLNDACNYLKQFINDVNNFKSTSNPTGYTSSDIVTIYEKNNFENKLKSVLNNGINFVYTTIKGYATDIDFFFKTYISNISNGQGKINNIKASRANLQKAIQQFENYYSIVNNSNFPIILISENTHEVLKSKLEEALEFVNISVADNETIEKHKEVKSNLDSINLSNYLLSLTSATTSTSSTPIVQVSISNKIVTQLKSYKAKVDNNKDKILESIDKQRVDESTKNISREITNYRLLSTSYNTLVNQIVLSNITSLYDQSTYKNFHGFNFETFNKYQSQEAITTNSYYIDNNKYENSYLNNFSYSQNSGDKTNMYDFAYFTMELCTLIIIIFAMMLVCNLITGETESGTIKLLLVRPYRRSKIITAKLLATIFFVLTFMIFSSIITLVGGYFLFGGANTPVLAIFNATTAFEISPMGLMILNILFLTLDVIFFVLLALMISIIFKNYAGSISCSLVVLIINFAFNLLFNSTFLYTLLPGMNLHLFKYLGNSFVSSSITGSISGVIQSLLITGIQTSMSFWFSLIISGIYSIVFLAISYSVFQKRDF